MAVFNGAFPVLPGKEDAARAFAKEAAGPRADQFAAQQAQADLTRETWSFQQTPMGSFVLVWFEGNVEKAFADIATDTGEFATWMKEQILDVTGVDMAAESDDPQPEIILDWSA
jgi:hypothetical protein